MILFKKAFALQNYLNKLKESGKSVGFVPTMGALHKGHLSLISLCKSESDITVCSIFINPTQFNDKKDFDKYPITIGEDILELERIKCDVLFLPSVQEIYPNGTVSTRTYNIGELETVLEGKYRPGHFQGVCQVVDRLLNIVQPAKLFLGQKDFQQSKVIERLIEILGLSIELVVGETTREPSGLAMSSRNMRLDEEEKEKALSIYSTLKFINEHYKKIAFDKLIEQSENFLLNNGFSKVDYVVIANAKTLVPVSNFDGLVKHVALIAAFMGDVRLIDNLLLED